MKEILAAAFAITLLTGCYTSRDVTAFETLPLDVQRTVRHEIGGAQIVSVLPATVAADPGYYQVDYISNGQRKSLKVHESSNVLTKSDWGYVIEEAAGAEPIRY